MSGCYVVKTVRLTAVEWAIIEEARSSLFGTGAKLERSTLVSEALLDAGHRLGIFIDSTGPGARSEAWPHALQRSEVAQSRISVSLTRTAAEILAAASKGVGTSEPRFLVGATLAYIARLKAQRQMSDSPRAVRMNDESPQIGHLDDSR